MTALSFPAASFLVAIGGAAGAWLRYLAGAAWLRLAGPATSTALPVATLTVNLAGSIAMGLLAGWLARHSGAGGSVASGEGLAAAAGRGAAGRLHHIFRA